MEVQILIFFRRHIASQTSLENLFSNFKKMQDKYLRYQIAMTKIFGLLSRLTPQEGEEFILLMMSPK